MQVTFYLTQASANTAAGPFNISGTTSGGAANTVEIQAGVSKSTLLAGYTEEIANNITGGTVTSTGATCNTTDTWSINELFVTPTPTPTALPCECYTIYNENGDRSIIAQYNRCSDGQLTNISVPSGSNRSVCIQSGGDVTSEDTGLTAVACGTPCTVNGDCTPCI
jgi:hypothetical protein